jgi:hypothetical protein
VVDSGEVGRSAVYSRYNNGPRTLPWGTPALAGGNEHDAYKPFLCVKKSYSCGQKNIDRPVQIILTV